MNAKLQGYSISNDKAHKKSIDTNYQTPCVQSILFQNLCGFVDLKIQSQSKGLWSTQQHLFQNLIKYIIQMNWSHNRWIQQFTNGK